MLVLLAMIAMFILTTGAYVLAGWLAMRRIAERINPEGLNALRDVFQYVLLPAMFSEAHQKDRKLPAGGPSKIGVDNGVAEKAK
jgi:hypothetical protein